MSLLLSIPVACSIFFTTPATSWHYLVHWFGRLLTLLMPHLIWAAWSQGHYFLDPHWPHSAQDIAWFHNYLLTDIKEERGGVGIEKRKGKACDIDVVRCCSVIFEVLVYVLSCLILITAQRNQNDNPHLRAENGNTYWVLFKHFVFKWN